MPHNLPVKHTDVLDQAGDDKVSPLAVFDVSAPERMTRGALSAVCDKEDMNFLALNLAHEIISGRRNDEEARAFQAKAVKAYLKGEEHPYTQKFIIDVPKGRRGTPTTRRSSNSLRHSFQSAPAWHQSAGGERIDR